jgi:NADPH-dependent F420 reductase
MDQPRYKIAVLGGTGPQGTGLALRLAAAGHDLTVGSRQAERARAVAAELSTRGGKTIQGSDNRSAAQGSEIVFLTVPYAVQRSTVEAVLDALRGKILVDTTVPLVPPKVGLVQLPQSQSAVAAIQQLAGSAVRVVSAFQNLSAQHLNELIIRWTATCSSAGMIARPAKPSPACALISDCAASMPARSRIPPRPRR